MTLPTTAPTDGAYFPVGDGITYDNALFYSVEVSTGVYAWKRRGSTSAGSGTTSSDDLARIVALESMAASYALSELDIDQLQKGAKTVRVSTGVDTSTNADFNNIIILGTGHTPYLHAVSDSSYLGSTISYFSSGPTELTFQNGETTVRGNLKINQWQGVTATCVAVGAEDATVWFLIGGSP